MRVLFPNLYFECLISFVIMQKNITNQGFINLNMTDIQGGWELSKKKEWEMRHKRTSGDFSKFTAEWRQVMAANCYKRTKRKTTQSFSLHLTADGRWQCCCFRCCCTTTPLMTLDLLLHHRLLYLSFIILMDILLCLRAAQGYLIYMPRRRRRREDAGGGKRRRKWTR